MTSKEIKKILKRLKKLGYSKVSIERVSDLPFGTLEKAEKGIFAKGDKAPLIALLKLYGQFPWVIDVADNNFGTEYSARKLVEAALNEALVKSKKKKG